jgi:hypothetical protein
MYCHPVVESVQDQLKSGSGLKNQIDRVTKVIRLAEVLMECARLAEA